MLMKRIIKKVARKGGESQNDLGEKTSGVKVKSNILI